MKLDEGSFQISTKQLPVVRYRHRTVQKHVQNNNCMFFPKGELESVSSFGLRSGSDVLLFVFFMD